MFLNTKRQSPEKDIGLCCPALCIYDLGVSPSRSFAGPFDTAFAGAQREHRRSEPMHGAMLKPQLGNSASHDLSPLRKRLGATVGATGTAPSSFDEVRWSRVFLL